MSAQWGGVPGLLPEDFNERQIFNKAADHLGSPLLAVWSQLNAASVMAPEQGSWGRYLAIMANEVRGAIIAQADLAAAVQAERERVREACVEAVYAEGWYGSAADFRTRAMRAIRALDLGPTDALAARIAEARRAGMEGAEYMKQIVLGLLRENEKLQRVLGLNADWTFVPTSLLRKHAAAIRAAMKEQGE